MRGFRYLRSVRKTYNEQGMIYFACVNYARLTPGTRRKIDRLCERAGGEYAPALKEYLTTEADWRYICDKHHFSDKTLERVRRKFYEAW